MINRMMAAIFAVVVLLTVIATAGCDDAPAVIRSAGGAAAHEAEQPSTLEKIKAAVEDLGPEAASEVIENACKAVRLPSPPTPPLTLYSSKVNQVENSLYAEQEEGAAGQAAAYAYCQAHDIANG